MGTSVDILELPVSETKDVNDLVKWLEKNKIHEISHPIIKIPEEDNSPALYLVGLFLVIGKALLILEEKGKLKVQPDKEKNSANDFWILMKNSKSENSLEKLIENRYNLDISIRASDDQKRKHKTSQEYSLNDIFGIWKGSRGRNLDKERQEQWGRKK
jgi:hypothetical protein